MEHLSQFNGEESPRWRGLSLEELRYCRALNLARREITSRQIRALSEGLTESALLSSSTSGIVGRLVRSLDYIDYAVIAVKAFSRIRGIFSRNKCRNRC